jgi:oxamate amidohydrolase
MSHPNGPRTGRPPTRAPLGMVSSSHYLATASGLRMLQNGGSAVDAIISTNAVLCVAYPHMAGLGGDGFWLIHDPRDKKVRAIDASGPAGARATRNWYSERAENMEIPARGGLAALTVPGAVDGWREAHEAYGKLSWRELFDDAIRYAAQGLPVSRSLADWLAQDVPVLTEDEDAAGVLLDDGRAMRDGERLVQADLARSIETVARDGARGGFYEGELAERFCAALAKKGSPLEAADLADYRAEWVEPIETTYRDHRVLEFPPATQGFAALQVLNLIEDYDIAGWGDGTADYYHHMAEAVQISFADRDAWLTDPRFVDIPLDKLISKDYARERRELINPEQAMAMEEVEPGVEWDTDQRREEVGAGADRGAKRRSPEGDTVYFCAVDADGLVVSAIQSVYHDFGAGVIAGDTGIIPQNRGSFFSLEVDHPNRLEPGKRTFHTIIPAMLLDGDEPVMAFGSMGGEGQPQTHAALLTRVLDFGYDVQQAIEAPRWLMGRTWGVESRDLSLEGRVPDQVLRELELRGQPVKVLSDWNDNMGHAAAIRIDRRTGFLEGGADPRGDGAAAGY